MVHQVELLLQAIRSGNYPVIIKNHVLILNWNRQTPPLLRQLALASHENAASIERKDRRGPCTCNTCVSKQEPISAGGNNHK